MLRTSLESSFYADHNGTILKNVTEIKSHFKDIVGKVSASNLIHIPSAMLSCNALSSLFPVTNNYCVIGPLLAVHFSFASRVDLGLHF